MTNQTAEQRLARADVTLQFLRERIAEQVVDEAAVRDLTELINETLRVIATDPYIPCPHCQGELYDSVVMGEDNVPRCVHCFKPVQDRFLDLSSPEGKQALRDAVASIFVSSERIDEITARLIKRMSARWSGPA